MRTTPTILFSKQLKSSCSNRLTKTMTRKVMTTIPNPPLHQAQATEITLFQQAYQNNDEEGDDNHPQPSFTPSRSTLNHLVPTGLPEQWWGRWWQPSFTPSRSTLNHLVPTGLPEQWRGRWWGPSSTVSAVWWCECGPRTAPWCPHPAAGSFASLTPSWWTCWICVFQTQSDAERVTQLLLLRLREGHITPAVSLPAGRNDCCTPPECRNTENYTVLWDKLVFRQDRTAGSWILTSCQLHRVA